jgi:hypothetical protein
MKFVCFSKSEENSVKNGKTEKKYYNPAVRIKVESKSRKF